MNKTKGPVSKNYAPPDLAPKNILDHDKASQLCSAAICFDRNDIELTRKIVETLAGTGIDKKSQKRHIWWQDQFQQQTAEWQDNVHKAIEFCDAFIIILSPHAVSNEYVKKDLAHAIKNGKRIIPVCVQNVTLTSLPEHFRKHNSWVILNEPDTGLITEEKFIQGMKIVMSMLDDEHRHAQYHTTILRRAIEWERHDFEKSLLLTDKDLTRAQHWLSASALGKSPKPTTLHLSFITASSALDGNMKKRKLIAIFFGVIVTIGIIWPSWGVFFFSLVFSHFFVYFSSNS